MRCTMTQSVARHSYLGTLSAGFTVALMLETAFLFDCLKFLVLKTYPPLESDGAKIVLVAETILLVSSYTGD